MTTTISALGFLFSFALLQRKPGMRSVQQMPAERTRIRGRPVTWTKNRHERTATVGVALLAHFRKRFPLFSGQGSMAWLPEPNNPSLWPRGLLSAAPDPASEADAGRPSQGACRAACKHGNRQEMHRRIQRARQRCCTARTITSSGQCSGIPTLRVGDRTTMILAKEENSDYCVLKTVPDGGGTWRPGPQDTYDVLAGTGARSGSRILSVQRTSMPWLR